MTRPTIATIHGHFFASQVPALSDLAQYSFKLDSNFNERLADLDHSDSDLRSRLADLDHIDLRIVEKVVQRDRCDSKEIGQAIHLSRYTVLARARKITEKGILEFEEGQKPKSGAKATFFFFLAPSLNRQAVIEALPELLSRSFQPSSGNFEKDKVETVDVAAIPGTVTQPELISLEQFKDILSRLDGNSLLVLRAIFEQNGATQKQICSRTGLSKTPVFRCLKSLRLQQVVVRDQAYPCPNTPSVLEYAYSLSPCFSSQHIHALKEQLGLDQQPPNVLSEDVSQVFAPKVTTDELGSSRISELLALDLPLLKILQVVATQPKGVSSSAIRSHTNELRPTNHSRLQKLLKANYLVREGPPLSPGREYLYFLAPTITQQDVFSACELAGLDPKPADCPSDNTDTFMKSQPSKPASSSDNLAEDLDIHKVIQAMAAEIVKLQQEVEQLKQGQSKIKATSSIQALLRSQQSQ